MAELPPREVQPLESPGDRHSHHPPVPSERVALSGQSKLSQQTT